MNWGGFLMGVSDYGLERLKEERSMKMKERLRELEEKYTIAAEDRKNKYNEGVVSGSRESADEPMLIEDVNNRGQVIGTRAKSASTIEAEAQARQRHNLENQNIESTIRARTEDAAIRREGLSIDRARVAAMNRGNDIAAGAAGSNDVAGALVEQALSGISKPSPTMYGRMRLLADKAVQASLDPREGRGVQSIFADYLAQEQEFGDPAEMGRERASIEAYRPRAPTANFRFQLPGTR